MSVDQYRRNAHELREHAERCRQLAHSATNRTFCARLDGMAHKYSKRSGRERNMPMFNAVAPPWQFAGARRARDRTARPKRRSFSELARGSIVACCFMCGTVIAEGGQPVANFKELIASAVKSSFVASASAALLEVSPLHPSRPPQMGDWMACLRVAINGQPALYAAFIEGQPPSVILLRRAVRFDDCGQDQYEPLPAPPAVDARSPGSRKK